MKSGDIPMVIRRCLTHSVQIYPYKLDTVLRMSEQFKIPDKDLEKFDSLTLKAYIEGLYYSGQEFARDWGRGHNILESIGFVKEEIQQGHRSYIKLFWTF